jgi:hypothetical protein
MRRGFAALALALPAVGIAACGHGSPAPTTAPAAKVSVQRGVVRIVLTPQAADRIGIRTAVTQAQLRTAGHTVIPYAAVLYAPGGSAFTYASPAPFVYVKTPITIDHVTGERAFLTRGPSAGTQIVTVGGDELLGVEDGVQQ